jgi:Zn-dependent M16 (insulinase) family peptidase
MTTKRKTGSDYRREWNLIKQSEKSLKAHVQQRLNELMKKYPDAKIIECTAQELLDRKADGMSLHTMITYIEIIEKWSADQQKVEQLTIDKIYDKIYNETKGKFDATLKNLS